MAAELGGEIAEFYARYRRGDDAPVIDRLVERLGAPSMSGFGC